MIALLSGHFRSLFLFFVVGRYFPFCSSIAAAAVAEEEEISKMSQTFGYFKENSTRSGGLFLSVFVRF